MTQDSRSGGWVDASGLPHILRVLGLAARPPCMGLAMAAIVATLAFGGVLDAIWKLGGGIEQNAVRRFLAAQELDQSFDEAPGEFGIFAVWRRHEQRCVLGLLGSSLPAASVAAGTPLGAYVEPHAHAAPLRNILGMVYGVWWLLECHTLYFLVFGAGALLIWSLAGGAICRLASVHFARHEKQSMRQGLAYASDRLWGGFVLAPCLPVAAAAVVAVLLILGGMVLRIPVFGDLLAGLAFVLAIFGGFVISLLLLGLLVGGSLFWPVVATEGSDAFDAVSRGLAYPFSKPFKAILYAIISVVFASLCWVLVNLFTYGVLTVTRGLVAFGTSPFGWWGRGGEGQSLSKLELLWPLGGPNKLYAVPDWSQLTWYEHASAAFIGFYVLLVIALMWSFLASFYFSGSTVVYFLLRRDVDAIDLQDVCDDDSRDGPATDVSPAGAES